MKKSAIRTLLLAAVLVLAALGIYLNQYPIQPDNSNLAQTAQAWLSRGTMPGYQANVKLYDSVDLGGERFVLMTFSDQVDNFGSLGMIRLDRGLHGHYKIDTIGYGTSDFRYQITAARGKAYLVLAGRNYGGRIAKIVFTCAGQEYHMPLPEDNLFLTSVEIDSSITHMGMEQLTFYNAAGEDITDTVEWSSAATSTST